MHHDSIVARGLAFLGGISGGGISYPQFHLKFHLLYDATFWGSVQEHLISLMWALIVAFFSGVFGYLGGIAVKPVVIRIRKYLNKKKSIDA